MDVCETVQDFHGNEIRNRGRLQHWFYDLIHCVVPATLFNNKSTADNNGYQEEKSGCSRKRIQCLNL
jgi:hypothetical protein